MAIELPERVVAELSRVSESLGIAVDKLVEDAVNQLLPAWQAAERAASRSGPVQQLLAAASQPPHRPAVASLHANRREREIAALWARVARRGDRDVPLGWAPEQLTEVADISPWCFATEGARGTAVGLDIELTQGNELTLDQLPKLLHAPAANEVVDAMRIERCEFQIIYRVSGRVPMPESLDCARFGGAAKVRLIAEPSPQFLDAYTPELVAVEICVDVAAERYEAGARRARINNDDCVPLPEANAVARSVLEHVLNVLRLLEVRIVHSDYAEEAGAPYRSWLTVTFGDGTVRRTETTMFVYNGSSSALAWSVGPDVATTPLQIDRALFAKTWKAHVELALLAGSSFLPAVDTLRRLLLVLESTHSRPDRKEKNRSALECAWREPAFQDRLRRLRHANDAALQGCDDDLELASKLAKLRDTVSHLKVRRLHNGEVELLPKPFGMTVYDPRLWDEVRRAIPIARAVARQIVDEVIAPHRMTPFRARRAGVAELIKLRSDREYARDPLVAEVLARSTLGRWFDDGDRDPAMLGLVLELLGSRDTERLAMSFVQIAVELPESYEALVAAIQRNGRDFAAHAVAVIANVSPSDMLLHLRDTLVTAGRTDLVELIAQYSPAPSG